MSPRDLPDWRRDVPPPPDGGPGGLVLAVCALVALAALEPRLLDGLYFDRLDALRPVADSLAIALGLWGWL